MALNFEKLTPKVSLREYAIADLSKVYRVDEINTEELISAQEGDKFSKNEVISFFEEISAGNNGRYYVGITGRVREREKEHNAEFLAVVDCLSLEKANNLEELAKSNGFYTGEATGNGHDDSTTKLYIYKIIPGVTIEG